MFSAFWWIWWSSTHWRTTTATVMWLVNGLICFQEGGLVGVVCSLIDKCLFGVISSWRKCYGGWCSLRMFVLMKPSLSWPRRPRPCGIVPMPLATSSYAEMDFLVKKDLHCQRKQEWLTHSENMFCQCQLPIFLWCPDDSILSTIGPVGSMVLELWGFEVAWLGSWWSLLVKPSDPEIH